MNNKLSGWDDTIVALATPPGVGAIGVLRLSGSKAIDVANAIFPSKNLHLQPSHTIHVGSIKWEGEVLDEVVVSLFKNPRSYTGEDVVEISCHGSPFVQQRVLDACMAAGARLAKPGEFTQRAFLAGKLDLTQAEAVADLIAAQTGAAQKTALHNIRGGFSTVLAALREQLIRFSALIELELDFSQEDVEFADRTDLKNLVRQILDQTNELLQSFRLGNVIRNGVSVAIIGKPNAGKSTLLNALLNEERAIVSDIPGTTRDTIEEVLNIDGILFRLIDTAGIRSHSADAIEAVGIKRSLQKRREADLVLYLFDATDTTPDNLLEATHELEREGIRHLLVGNKVDQETGGNLKFGQNTLMIAAKTGMGIDTLRQRMVAAVLENASLGENVVVTNARHFHALQQVQQSLQDVLSGLDANIPGDLLALDIRRSLHYLGEITGEVTNEDQLDFIFSKFCIGK
ncbi:tRNA uridine-5-carboxymethylaminomethyl(34) synthesis GTPase MnmE [Paracnuella aquatica]|uniref:tRNA uridine-5-carboxymethylaminomethyl(34) synthesis GTPase MnmE n=1 Tax=Paracnuella aquatica TaxID=2268757 RepID=UPI000DEEDC6B|nr:tRNA uridine-5-carboxymethylaminomethyl(34) synthesis GTPase MnmE [Paracnuella aquatica]RPD48761.1 tRNA uridine-5-carboxymethylaminomethyl(34) synthesis GTPase MnmE [Paracnuella aquatica]